MQDETDVLFAVENMFPLRARGAEVAPYAPSWNPVPMDYPHVTLDLSHTAVSGSDALAMADELGARLAHVHLADGTGPANRDEHLVPGRGTQPCAQLLHRLAAEDYQGLVVLEVKTFRAPTREARQADLAEALEFARANLARPGRPRPPRPRTVRHRAVGPGRCGPGRCGPGRCAHQPRPPAGPRLPRAAASPASATSPPARSGMTAHPMISGRWPPGPGVRGPPDQPPTARRPRPAASAGRGLDRGCMLPVMTSNRPAPARPGTLITVAPTGAESDKASVPALPVTLDELIQHRGGMPRRRAPSSTSTSGTARPRPDPGPGPSAGHRAGPA